MIREKSGINRYNPSNVPDAPAANKSSPREKTAGQLQVNKEASVLTAQSKAVMTALVHRGTDETWDRWDYFNQPVDGTTLINYQVPAGHVLEVTGISFVYSEPQIQRTRSWGWRPVVNANAPEGLGFFPGFDFFTQSCASLTDLIDITSIWVQAGSVIGIEIHAFNIALPCTDFWQASARLAGRLYSTVSPLIHGVM